MGSSANRITYTRQWKSHLDFARAGTYKKKGRAVMHGLSKQGALYDTNRVLVLVATFITLATKKSIGGIGGATPQALE